MSDASLLVWGIVALLILILLTLGFIFVYSGLFASFQVGAGKPPVQSVYIGYKYGQGPYKDCGSVFTETAACAPGLSCLGIYYDNPEEVEPSKTRYAVGAILSEGSGKPDEKIVSMMKERGFKFHTLPAVSSCVRTTFPYKTPLSVYLLVCRVYPALNRYVQEHRLCAHPYLEIYKDDTIHIMAPLAKQDEFYVPEAQDSDVNDDATTEYSSGSHSLGDSSVERQDFPPFDEKSTEDLGPKPKVEETKPVVVGDEDKVKNDESPVEPGPQVTNGTNGHESGSEESTGTTSSFEQVNMDMEELQTPTEEDAGAMEGTTETKQSEQSEEPAGSPEEVPEKQKSADPERQE